MKLDGNYGEKAKIFKAFCDENRLKIIESLCKGEKCACVILEELSISQSTLSHHMKILVDSGIVENRKDGKWMHYSMNLKGINETKKLLDAILKLDDDYNKCNKISC